MHMHILGDGGSVEKCSSRKSTCTSAFVLASKYGEYSS